MTRYFWEQAKLFIPAYLLYAIAYLVNCKFKFQFAKVKVNSKKSLQK